MESHRTLSRAALCVGLALMGTAAAADTRTITVREQLNQTYGQERLDYPFTAKDRACVADSLRLVGPRGPVAVQLAQVEYWPGEGRFVKSARLTFICDALPPLATHTYTVSSGPAPAPTPAPRTDLAVAATEREGRPDGSVEITTAHVGVRLLLGVQTYDAPVPLADVPGPLLGMRFGQVPWAGGSHCVGDAQVKTWSARLTDSGPVFARVAFHYELADGNAAEFTAIVAAGDNTVRWEMDVEAEAPALSIDFLLPPMPGVTEAVFPKGYGQWARDRKKAVAPSDEPFTQLAPDTSVACADMGHVPFIRLIAPDGRELQLRSRDAGVWVDPKPMSYAGDPVWTLDAVGRYMTATWRHKGMPVNYRADGTSVLRATLAQGRRKWSVSDADPLVGERLAHVNEMVLDWPQTTHHPHVYMTRAEVDEALKRTPALKGGGGWGTSAYLLSGCQTEVGRKANLVPKLKEWLGKLGNFDVFRKATGVMGLYDAIIDTNLVTSQDRALLRAQMAYLGYVLADPMCWSMERGYLTGNPNMSVSYTLSLGILACLLPDHPMAPPWAAYCDRWLDKWLSDEVGAGGEWLPEGMSYGGQVSLTPLLAYVTAAKRAGYRDFSADPRLRKLVLYFAKEFVPPDPRRKGMRVSPPVGRAHAWQTSGYLGLAAKILASSDPAASRALQWMWAQGNYPVSVGEARLGGFSALYLDKTLPAEPPDWGTCFFPQLGAVLRSGFNTPNEHYLNLISHVDSRRNLDIWSPDVGIVAAWFAYGKPISEGFNLKGSYQERHELLRNGVRLARNYDGAEAGKTPFGHYTKTIPGPLVALPGADYVRASYVITFPDTRTWFPDKLPAWPKVTAATEARLTWTRQALFVRDADAAGPHWLLLRDTTIGGQPTAWQFWTLSKRLGTPAQAADTNFVVQAPGNVILPVRELAASDRYTAVGQFDVDVEYFIAQPATTPRHTLRYGGKSHLLEEYQDLLHLQQPGDGAYCVAVYPRRHETPAPTFAALDGGKIVRVSGDFGTDYALLTTEPTDAVAGAVRMAGTAATVQVRPNSTTLSLADGGTVQCGDFGLKAEHAVALTIAPDLLTVQLPPDHTGGALTLIVPTLWRLRPPSVGASLSARDGLLLDLTVPQELTRVTLVRGD